MPIFETSAVAAVLAHMNGDHPHDNLLIARAFGHPDAAAATMTGLDENAGYWSYTVGQEATELEPTELTVPWSTTISERPEIRREIVVLYDAACTRLGVEPRPH